MKKEDVLICFIFWFFVNYIGNEIYLLKKIMKTSILRGLCTNFFDILQNNENLKDLNRYFVIHF